LDQDQFFGYHSEWNLGSPGGWDYQRITQKIGKAVWRILSAGMDVDLQLDFDHPLLSPVHGFVDMLVQAHADREGSNPGLIAVVAEEETLEDVIENKNLARHLNAIDGLSGALMAPHELALKNGCVCWQGQPVSIIFMDFNTDVLLDLHRRHGLAPLLQAVGEGRVINPRGTEPINSKSMFELLTDPEVNQRFNRETVERTPWTRRFLERRTVGPDGEPIADLIEWTRANWEELVLKPERGYSGHGVRVGGVHPNADDAIGLALETGHYIVQQKVPLYLWAEDMPELDADNQRVVSVRRQTDFRCLFGSHGQFGFVARYGQVPTNVGSGGGFQPMAVLKGDVSVRDATERINERILSMDYAAVEAALSLQEQMAVDHHFTYLLGPVKIALRPRIITAGQIQALGRYAAHIWEDCLTLEDMWHAGTLDDVIDMDPEELAITRSQPWKGSPAILSSDGIFSFGAHREPG